MSAIMFSFIQSVIKYVLFIVVAVAAVICGRKYRIYKDSQNIEMAEENKESK